MAGHTGPGTQAGVLDLADVRVGTPDGRTLLTVPRWQVRSGEHWALLGRNGAGKSTLLSLAAARRFPTAGTVSVLGRRFGATDLRELRGHLSVVDPALRLPPRMTVLDVVLTGSGQTVQASPTGYPAAVRSRAADLVELVGLAALAGRPVGVLSAGERARTRLARGLLPEPVLMLLDEPAAALDLPGREDLLGVLDRLREQVPELASVLVSHHLEELPAGTTHALLLAGGQVSALGPVAEVLTSAAVSAAFGLPVRVRRDDGRWSATAVRPAA